MPLQEILSLFLTRLVGGYAFYLGVIGPSVPDGPWRRVSLFVIAGLSVVAIAAGAPWLSCAATAAAAILLERAITFRIRGLGSTVWILPFGIWIAVANEAAQEPGIDSVLGALALGGTLGAMLLGHSYLIATKLSFAPLKRMTLLLFCVLVLRAAFVVPAFLTEGMHMMDTVYLSARAAFGLLLPLLFGWMVIQCARIESNQSATGILYAMTALVFLGELTAIYLKLNGVVIA
ncbi:MAG: hypothetical protein ACYTGV_06480 [Planctomycetota bacterium]|jgi:hypothetical protein